MKLRFGYLVSGIITGFILLLTFIWTQPDGRLHIVFCNVGQGDATYIRFPDGRDMLVDTGPDNGRALACLGRYMPFWDRTIDIVIISHPQADHAGGLAQILKRYTVTYQIPSDKKTLSYGDRIDIGATSLSVVGPQFVSSDLNANSLVLDLRYGRIDVLLPGDSPLQVFSKPVAILKVPHHGSKTGMTLDSISKLKPQMSVISVGKNSYGHPSKEVVDMLQTIGSTVLRTDKEGDIEIVSDGVVWDVVH